MTKEQFFKQLESKLIGLPESERLNIRGVYEDLFRKAMENGKSEEEVVRSLGYSQLYGGPPAEGRSFETYAGPPAVSDNSGLKPVLASLALGLFNLVFIFGPFAAISAVLLALCVTSLVLAAGPIWILIGTGVPETTESLLLELFAAMALFGLGTLMLLGLSSVVRFYVRAVKTYVRLNIRLIKGE